MVSVKSRRLRLASLWEGAAEADGYDGVWLGSKTGELPLQIRRHGVSGAMSDDGCDGLFRYPVPAQPGHDQDAGAARRA